MLVMNSILQIAVLLACVAIILLCIQGIMHGRAAYTDFITLRSEHFAEGQADIAQAIQHTIDVSARLGAVPRETLHDIREFVVLHNPDQAADDTMQSKASQ